ncbi:MAG: ATP-binding protein [Phycisphaerae bacterium]|nr:ATP-binding protein [Saprospiraceae bacterium]
MKKQCAITIKNELPEIARVVQVFDRFWKSHNLADEAVNAVHVAIDEMLSNIVLHAFEDAETHKIYIKIILTKEAVILEIRDDGKPFNPFSFAQTKADTESLLTERPIGGLGLHLVTSLMDSCEYHYLDKHNCSILRKNY